MTAQCFEMFNEKNEPVGFIAYINQPARQRYFGKKLVKRITRLVIFPDYQGIGLGTALLNFLAGYLKKQHLQVSINTTAKNLIFALSKSPKWLLHSYAKNTKPARFGANTSRINYTKKQSARIGVRKACFMFRK